MTTKNKIFKHRLLSRKVRKLDHSNFKAKPSKRKEMTHRKSS